jgi:hypothetical protein
MHMQLNEEKLNEWSQKFLELANSRHTEGESKYGSGTFLQVDTLQMALEELADMMNYIWYTGIKVMALQEVIGGDGSTAQPNEEYKDVGEKKVF